MVNNFQEKNFKCILLDENDCIVIQVSLSFVLKIPIDDKSALAKLVAWRWAGTKPLSGQKMAKIYDIIWRH